MERRRSEWSRTITSLTLSALMLTSHYMSQHATRYALVYNDTEGIIVEYNKVDSDEEQTILRIKGEEFIVPEGYQLIIDDQGDKEKAYENASEIVESDILDYYSDVKGSKYALVYNEEEALIIEYDHIDQNTIYLNDGKTFTVQEGYSIQTYENVPQEKVSKEASLLSKNIIIYDDIEEKNYAVLYNEKEAIIIPYHHVETEGTHTRVYVNEKQYFYLTGRYSITLCGQVDKETAKNIASSLVDNDQVSFYGDEGVKQFKLHK